MVPITGWSHETTLTAEPISAALAREFVRLHLVAHHLVHLVEDVRLVVSELATNAVGHAQTPFVVTLASANGSIVLAIQDGSPSAPVRSRPDVTDMSGRGLMIVELLSQAWGTSTDAHGFKSVWASFPMSDPRGPPRSRTRSTIARATFAERLAAAARAA